MHPKTRNFSIVFAGLLCCLCVISCKREPLPPEPPSDPELTVKNELTPFSAGGGSAELRFTTNRAWEIAIEPLKAGGGSAVASHKTGDGDCSDAMSPKSMGGAGAAAGRQRSSADWYEIYPLNGGPNSEGEEIAVTVTVQPNEGYSPRGFVIVLRTKPNRSEPNPDDSGQTPHDPNEKPLEKRIEVTQSKKNAIIIGENRVEVSSDEQTIIVKVRSNVKYEVLIKDGSGWISDAGANVSGKDGIGLIGNTAANVPGKVTDDPIINSSGGTTTKKASEKSGNISDKIGATGIGIGSTGIGAIKTGSNEAPQSYNEAGDLENTTHSFRIAANPAADPRVSVIVFKDKDSELFDELTVVQAAKNVIRLNDGTVNVTNDKQTITVETESNVVYDITIDEGKDWISEAPQTKGLTKRSHSFNIAANPTYEPRTGTIIFKDRKSALKVDLKIIQAGMESERTILKAIYESTGGNGWTGNDNWLSDKPLNEWYGVETDAEGHVIGLRLRRNNLKGVLSPKIAQLTQLQHIDMSWNTLTGEFDKDYHLGNLVNLDSVDVSHNDLSGGMSNKWGELKKIRYLNVSSNRLRGIVIYPQWKDLDNDKVIELIANDNYMQDYYQDALYNHPEWDRHALQLIRQRYGGDGVGGGVRLDQLKKPIHLPDLTFTNLTTGAERSMKEIYQNNTLTMLFHWDPTQEESQKFVDTVLPRFLTLFGGQGFAAIGILPKDDETPGGNKYKDAARQFLASREIKWAAVEDYHDDQGRRIVLPDYQFPSYLMIDQTGKVILDAFKGKLVSGHYPKLTYESMSELEHIDDLNELVEQKIGQSNYESVDYSRDKTYELLHKATKGSGVNVLLMGDAFTDIDVETGYYKQIMEYCKDAFFSTEPNNTYRDYFNVYVVYAISKKPRIGKSGLETALGTMILDSAPGIECDRQKLTEYATVCPPIFVSRSVILNGFGVGLTFMGQYSSSAHYGFSGASHGALERMREIFIHESVGHSFGLLGDEYQASAPGQGYSKDQLRGSHERGFYFNLSLTDDPNSVYWSHLIKDKRYPYVGVFEGGFYTNRGVWRSENKSVMDSSGISYFNAWSRELIVRRIKKYAGEEFKFEEFVAKDRDDGRPGKESKSFSNENNKRHDHYAPIILDAIE